MCGQCGIILWKKRRTRQELDSLGNMFTALLQYNELRGRDATGIYMANKSGEGNVLKTPVSATYLTKLLAYQRMINKLNSETVALIGHTRFRTVGTPMINENNHPIISTHCVGTHNGTIVNHDGLFKNYGWSRTGQVDSEAIFRCADSNIENGKLNMERFSEMLKEFCGTMTFILHNRQEPNVVYVGLGNMPLSLRHHPKLRCLCYSSELMPLVVAGKDFKGWQLLTLSAMTIYKFDIFDLSKWDSVPMRFNCPP